MIPKYRKVSALGSVNISLFPKQVEKKMTSMVDVKKKKKECLILIQNIGEIVQNQFILYKD